METTTAERVFSFGRCVRNQPSYLESSAGLNSDSGLLNRICLIYIDLLYGYLALELHGIKRWGVLTAALVHILLSFMRSFAGISLFSGVVVDWFGFVLLLSVLVLMLLSQKKTLRRISSCLCAVVGTMFVIWGITRYVGVEMLYPLTNPVTALLNGLPHTFYTLLCNITGLLCAVQVVTGVVHSMLLRQHRMQAIKSNSQAVQEKYEQAQASVRQTAVFRHEWKNHIATLYLLAQKQDQEGIRNYLNRPDGELEQLSPKNYTANPTVNTILQRFAAQAEKHGVAFRVSAMLPETLQIREEDLCGFLFNLLDNALEAASQAEQREVFCSMQVRRQYLAISCENTYGGILRTDENGQLLTTKGDVSDHGFGLLKMRTIAEKYDSVLDISYDECRFTVMTALKLLPEKAIQ